MATKSVKKRPSVLFVCLGNICRSPIAEALFLQLIDNKQERDQWKVDSAALGTWHIGGDPDPRTMLTLEKNGIKYSHKARQVTKQDFSEFDYIIGMDHDNISALQKLKPANSEAKVVIFGTYDTVKDEHGLVVPDPYFGDDISDFDNVFEKVSRCCNGFYDEVTGTTK